MSSRQTETPLLSLRDICLSYGKRVILDHTSADFYPGSFTVIAGESGCGKSSLLYILGGLLKPDSGQYLFRGRPVYRWLGEWGLSRFRKKNIGFLFQDFRLLPFLTVEENVRFPVLFSGVRMGKSKIQQRLKQLGIAHRAKAYPHTISGGEAQRTALARALLLEPPLLLLDEPTGNLDRDTEIAIVNLLLELQREGLTLICASHSEYMMAHADRVMVLAGGKLSLKAVARKRSRMA